MFSKAEKAVLKTAKSFILRELETHGVARIDGLGEFAVKDFTYRDPITKEVATTKTVRFRPFTAAKRVAKAGLPKLKKKTRVKKTGKVSMPAKKKTEPQKLTPGETYEEAPKKKKKPPKKATAFAFKLGRK